MEIREPELLNPTFYDDIAFEIKILSSETKDEEGIKDIVTKVNYKLRATYEDIYIEYENYIIFLDDAIDTNNFVAFEDLTKEQVISWIEDNSPLKYLKHSLAVAINEQLSKRQPAIKSFNFED